MEALTSNPEMLRSFRKMSATPRLTLEMQIAKLASEIAYVALDMQELAKREARLTREMAKKIAQLEAVTQ